LIFFQSAKEKESDVMIFGFYFGQFLGCEKNCQKSRNSNGIKKIKK